MQAMTTWATCEHRCRLLCYIGHITAIGLEIASLQLAKTFEARSLLAETLLTALDVGHLLLKMVPSKAPDRRKMGTKSYEDFLREASKGADFINLVKSQCVNEAYHSLCA